MNPIVRENLDSDIAIRRQLQEVIILRVGIVKAPCFTTFAGQKVRILRGSVAVNCRTCAVPGS